MKTVLDDLWYGNITPCENVGGDEASFRELRHLILRNRENLSHSLTELQKETLEKYDECSMELSTMTEKQIFINAFRLGAQIMLEMLQTGE